MLFEGQKRIDQEISDTYEAAPNFGKNCAIKLLKKQELTLLSHRLHKEWVENCCNGGLVTVETFYQRKEDLDQQSLNAVASSLMAPDPPRKEVLEGLGTARLCSQ